MKDCIFCKIARGEIKANIVYKDSECVAFEDINPKAPVHAVIIPREHIERVSDIDKNTVGLVGKMILAAAELAKKRNIAASGYRLVVNCNKDAGREVFHLHLHLLGGRKFAWPPG